MKEKTCLYCKYSCYRAGNRELDEAKKVQHCCKHKKDIDFFNSKCDKFVSYDTVYKFDVTNFTRRKIRCYNNADYPMLKLDEVYNLKFISESPKINEHFVALEEFPGMLFDSLVFEEVKEYKNERFKTR